MNVFAGTVGVRAPPSVDRSLTLSMLDGGAGVCVCLYARVHSCVRGRLCLPVCVNACVRGRSYAIIGGGYGNQASS